MCNHCSKQHDAKQHVNTTLQASMASINMQNDKAKKQFAESLQMVVAPKPPKKTQQGEDQGKPEKPVSFLDNVAAKMKEILQEAGEARQFSISLRAHELSSDLVKQLDSHCLEMEQHYKDLQQLQLTKVKKPDQYNVILNKAELKSQWYQPRAQVAKKMQAAVSKPAVKKEKKPKEPK